MGARSVSLVSAGLASLGAVQASAAPPSSFMIVSRSCGEDMQWVTTPQEIGPTIIADFVSRGCQPHVYPVR